MSPWATAMNAQRPPPRGDKVVALRSYAPSTGLAARRKVRFIGRRSLAGRIHRPAAITVSLRVENFWSPQFGRPLHPPDFTDLICDQYSDEMSPKNAKRFLQMLKEREPLFQSSLKKAKPPGGKTREQIEMKAFRSSVASYEGRSRYNRLIRWLKSREGFTESWDDAGGNLESGHDVRVLITRPVFIRTGPEFQSWKMFQTEVVVSSQLPVFRLNIWMPLSSRWPETLRSLSKTAQAPGYRLSKAPFIIEKHVDESRLRDIGGWIE